jgi:hypothetical protein
MEAGQDDADTRTRIFTLRDIILYAENDAKIGDQQYQG